MSSTVLKTSATLHTAMFTFAFLFFVPFCEVTSKFAKVNVTLSCPVMCRCVPKSSTPESETSELKVTCNLLSSANSPSTFLTKLTKGFMDTLPTDVIDIDLSRNNLTGWDAGVFQPFSKLLKLNLSFNPILELGPNSFKGLQELKTLDLSHTEIYRINKGALDGLLNLRRLILLDTPLKTVSNESMSQLKSLNRLDIQSDILTCDCHLKWFSYWLNVSQKNSGDIRCSLPLALRTRSVAQLTPEELRCDLPMELPHFELAPSSDQIVFEEDSLQITCEATPIDRQMFLFWYHKEVHVIPDNYEGLQIVSKIERSLRISILKLDRVTERHSGVWSCVAVLGEKSVPKSIKVIVLPEKVSYCPAFKSTDNKGSYGWPQTMEGVMQKLPCVISNSYSGFQRTELQVAYRSCNKDGVWGDPDTSRCPYVSEVTRMLEETASLNMSLSDVTADNVMKMFRSIGPQTSDGETIRDHTEICFLAKILQQLARHSKKFSLIAGEVVVGLVDLSMNVSPIVLLRAQLMDSCCSRIIKALEETVASLLTNDSTAHLSFSSKNLAVQGHRMTFNNAKSIFCRSSVPSGNHGNQTSNVSLTCTEDVSEIERHRSSPADDSFHSTILVPATSSARNSNNQIIIITSFRNPSIFPITNKSNKTFAVQNVKTLKRNIQKILEPPCSKTNKCDDDDDDEGDDLGEVLGPVVSAKLVTNEPVSSSSSSLTITMISHSRKSVLTPVSWKLSSSKNGEGRWTDERCKLEDNHRTVYGDEDDDYAEAVGYFDYHASRDKKVVVHSVRFACHGFGSFALAQKPSPPHHLPRLLWEGANEISIIVYIGAVTTFVSALIIVIVYIVNRRQIEISQKTHHAVINFCISLALLAASFALGVKSYRVDILCRISAILLHYFSLSALMWISVINYKLLHKMSKLNKPLFLDIRVNVNPNETKMKPKPLIPEYLLGWGIPAILCGIGSAISWNNHLGVGAVGFALRSRVCFLNRGATLIMMFTPSAAIVLINFIFFIKVICLFYRHRPDLWGFPGGRATPRSQASLSSSYPPTPQQLPCSRSVNSVLAGCDEDERESKKMAETSRRLLLLLNRSVAGARRTSDNGVGGINHGFSHHCSNNNCNNNGLVERIHDETFSSYYNDGSRNGYHGFGNVYPTSSQLCGSAATLLLYCATWATGMLSVMRNPPVMFPSQYNSKVYQLMFVCLSLTLSFFMLVYFCFGRRDVRKAICCRQRRVGSSANEEILQLRNGSIDFNSLPAGDAGGYNRPANFEVELGSFDDDDDGQLSNIDSSCSSSERTPKDVHGSLQRSQVQLLPIVTSSSGRENGEVCGGSSRSFLPPQEHSVVVDSRSSAVFYNPRQNGAAKKYWEKAKKKRSKSSNYGQKSSESQAQKSTPPLEYSQNQLPHISSLRSTVSLQHSNGYPSRNVATNLSGYTHHQHQIPQCCFNNPTFPNNSLKFHVTSRSKVVHVPNENFTSETCFMSRDQHFRRRDTDSNCNDEDGEKNDTDEVNDVPHIVGISGENDNHDSDCDCCDDDDDDDNDGSDIEECDHHRETFCNTFDQSNRRNPHNHDNSEVGFLQVCQQHNEAFSRLSNHSLSHEKASFLPNSSPPNFRNQIISSPLNCSGMNNYRNHILDDSDYMADVWVRR